MGSGDSKILAWRAYRALDRLATWVIRGSLLVLMGLWSDRDLAEVTLILWARLWGPFPAAASYLGFFLVGLHWETSRFLGKSESEGNRRRVAILLVVLAFCSFLASLLCLPQITNSVSIGLLAWILVWMALFAPWFLLNHWPSSAQGRPSPVRLALLGITVGGAFGWIYLWSPWVIRV